MLFTAIDWFTNWVEVIPCLISLQIPRLIYGWVSCNGVSDDVTSDQGRQFTSALCTELNHTIGAAAYRMTAFHPQANGYVE
ncbi:Uncharacterized protein FKW44_007038 [Caligus rogercresseyi]|uniref:Integrase catalytic domain-containing protein n=1 Tax=Caligus rogercresseyi TaxID=217165 RepID=A0A7T8QTA5_CALRO|nr:Uncharacterized protein FKW44_007038 [Caligus rogercresseyi]